MEPAERPTQNLDAEQPRDRIGNLLVEAGVITREELREAVEVQRDTPTTRLGEILVDLGHAREEEVVRVVAESVGCCYMRLDPGMASRDAVASLPRDLLEQHNMLPLSLAGGRLTIALETFTDVFLIEEITRVTGLAVEAIAATASNIRDVREAVLRSETPGSPGASAQPEGALDDILGQIGEDDLHVIDRAEEDDADLEATASDSPVVKLVNYIIKTAAQSGASDIHIEPEEDAFRVRYRVDGDLVRSIRPPARLLPAVVSRVKILAGMDISERRLPQDGGLSVTLADRSIDLRISTMTAKFGEKIVIRIVDRDAGLKTVDDLGMSPRTLDAFKRAIREPNGIVLVTGPTGSGKTTTLYSALDAITSIRRNVSTIEDPVERILPGVNQFEILPKAGFTFAGALRSMLRQDPDVIMIGEIRDSETARLATEAALTGHLVLSTLHTNDAPTAVPRLVNMGVEPYLVAATLRAVIAQRLVPRLCPACSTKEALTGAERETIGVLVGGECPIDTASHAPGCQRCAGTGRRGRVGVYDSLMLDEDSLSPLVRGEPWKRPDTTAPSGLLREGLTKVDDGFISLAALLELVSHASDSRADTPAGLSAAA